MTRKYHLFDAKGKILGRLAVEIANVLSGRTKTDFAPNVDGGDFVVVINSDEVRVTGNKAKGKTYYKHTGYLGSLKEITFEKQMEKDSTKVIADAVSGMLPKNKLRAKMLTRLLIVKNGNHSYSIDIKH